VAPGEAQLVPAQPVHSREILVALTAAVHGCTGDGVHVGDPELLGVGDGVDVLHWPRNWQLGDGDGELPLHGWPRPLPWHDGFGFGCWQNCAPCGQVQFWNWPCLQMGLVLTACTWIHGTNPTLLVGNSGMTGALFRIFVM
jgi:hypothetical protein